MMPIECYIDPTFSACAGGGIYSQELGTSNDFIPAHDDPRFGDYVVHTGYNTGHAIPAQTVLPMTAAIDPATGEVIIKHSDLPVQNTQQPVITTNLLPYAIGALAIFLLLRK